MSREIMNDCSAKMTRALDAMKKELIGLRSGRAHPSMVADIRVDYYGTLTPIKQLATISIPEARLIVIQPYDINALGAIEKAIQAADIGVNPNSDGHFIRMPIPPLSQETRKDIVKQAKKIGEESKVAIRNVRPDSNEKIKAAEKDKKITEDERKKNLDEIQKITDDFVKQVDDLVAKKEADILQI